MFDDNMFEEWLNRTAVEVFDKVGREERINSEEMMILVLKAQANHFMHLDTDLRTEMKTLREDMNALREDMNKRFEAVDRRFNSMQWLIGLGIAFLTVLMSLYRFFQYRIPGVGPAARSSVMIAPPFGPPPALGLTNRPPGTPACESDHQR